MELTSQLPGAWLLQGAIPEFFWGHSWIAHDLNHIIPDVHAIWKTFTFSGTPHPHNFQKLQIVIKKKSQKFVAKIRHLQDL
jgi:hypothetical protein